MSKVPNANFVIDKYLFTHDSAETFGFLASPSARSDNMVYLAHSIRPNFATLRFAKLQIYQTRYAHFVKNSSSRIHLRMLKYALRSQTHQFSYNVDSMT